MKYDRFPSTSLRLMAAILLMMANASSVTAGVWRVALADGQAAAGIREALVTSTADAVRLVGRPNGYFDNAAIRILLPGPLKPVETGLRAIGYGPQIDQFVLSMNRAAEAAAPKAEPIFEQAITNMTLADAQRIVMGGKHAATDYFRQATSNELVNTFTPVVKQSMSQYAVIKQYDELLGRYHNLTGPLALGKIAPGLTQNFDITHYVVEKSLDGLFYVVAQEEEKIRTNPAAQVTPLLKEVFGNIS